MRRTSECVDVAEVVVVSTVAVRGYLLLIPECRCKACDVPCRYLHDGVVVRDTREGAGVEASRGCEAR